MERPQYILHKDGDWSGVYYGESLERYFPLVPGVETSQGHWYFHFAFEKYHPYLDLYVFYVKKDLKNIDMEKIANFGRSKKPSLKIILGRISVLEKFTEYCSSDFKDIWEFLFQPVAQFINLR